MAINWLQTKRFWITYKDGRKGIVEGCRVEGDDEFNITVYFLNGDKKVYNGLFTEEVAVGDDMDVFEFDGISEIIKRGCFTNRLDGAMIQVEPELCEAMRDQGYGCNLSGGVIHCQRIKEKELHFSHIYVACDGTVGINKEAIAALDKEIYKNYHS